MTSVLLTTGLPAVVFTVNAFERLLPVLLGSETAVIAPFPLSGKETVSLSPDVPFQYTTLLAIKIYCM
jgi:xanthine/uracil permease